MSGDEVYELISAERQLLLPMFLEEISQFSLKLSSQGNFVSLLT